MPIDRDPATYLRRSQDWRFGRIVYQAMVDRFAPSRRLADKAAHYTAPRRLLEWGQPLPSQRHYFHDERVSEAETLFYGGDLDSLRGRLDHLQSVGAEVLYLNPIFEAFTNHKYDATDFFRIDPQYGTEEELRALADELHARGMRLMLDGVFNHMGRRAPLFRKAQAENGAPERAFFVFGDKIPNGYRGWRNVANLPELNLEDPAVADYLFAPPKGVVPYYLTEVGIDGWRLDVAPDLGHRYLTEIMRVSRQVRPDSVIIGECWNYPEEWLELVDGVLNMHLRSLLLELVGGRLRAAQCGRLLERMILDSGIEGILKSHVVLDNHDVPRHATTVADVRARRLARILQFTLPGCPVIYYGSELGMEGGADPFNRGSMRWDLLREDNEELALVRKLAALRKEAPALTIGDFRLLDCEEMLAFIRLTDKARESVVVVANPTMDEVKAMVAVRDSRFMDSGPLECLLSGQQTQVHSGLLDVTVPAQEIRIFRTTDRGANPGYSMLKRVP